MELEVIRQCPCGIDASTDDKIDAINTLSDKYSVRVLCEALELPRGTYYNRKRREGSLTSYEINDILLKPMIEQIFRESKCSC